MSGEDDRKRVDRGEASGAQRVPAHQQICKKPIVSSTRELLAAWFLGAILGLPVCRAHPHPVSKEIWREREWRPLSPGTPDLRGGVLTSTSPGPPAGRGLCTPLGTWRIGKCREGQTQTQTQQHGGPRFSGTHNHLSGQGQMAAHEKPRGPHPARTFPIHPPCPALSPPAQSWGPPKTGGSLPRKVTLAILSPLPRSSETVLRWTSRAMPVWGARTGRAGAAGKGGARRGWAPALPPPLSAPPPPPAPPPSGPQTRHPEPASPPCSGSRASGPASGGPRRQPRVYLGCVRACWAPRLQPGSAGSQSEFIIQQPPAPRGSPAQPPDAFSSPGSRRSGPPLCSAPCSATRGGQGAQAQVPKVWAWGQDTHLPLWGRDRELHHLCAQGAGLSHWCFEVIRAPLPSQGCH